MNVQVTVPDLTGAECGDIAITAAEGGIGYWSQIETYDWSRWSPESQHQHYINGEAPSSNLQVPDDFVFYTIHEMDDDEMGYKPDGIDITAALIKQGFERCLAADKDKGGWAVQGLLSHEREDWTGEIDSEIADNIIQFGVFGEIKWG